MRNEVVITGIGMMTPLGLTAAETAKAWTDGISARRAPVGDLRELGIALSDAAVLPEFDPAAMLGDRRFLKYMSDAALLGCIAAREALAEADVARRFSGERVGLYAGTGLAAARIQESLPMVEASIDEAGRFSYSLLGSKGLAAASPLLSFKILANMPPCLISILNGIKGPNLIFSPWEEQTAEALVEGWRAVGECEVDCALGGAADFASHPATFLHLRQSGRLADHEYPAPGAAYVVLERIESARRDGKFIYGLIHDAGTGNSNGAILDPLSARLGRAFAAAPAILTALALKTGQGEVRSSGADQREFHVAWEPVR